MTVKRDLKRRVRQRQARTGEAYVTARRHVLAARPTADTTADGSIAPDDAVVADTRSGADAEASAVPGADTGAAPTAAGAGAPEGTVAAPEANRSGDATEVPAAAGRSAPEDEAAFVAAAVAARASPPPSIGHASTAVSVIELVDVSDEARRAGILCRVAMFPGLAARVAPARVLARLRDLLLETVGDPQMLLLSQVALAGTALRRPSRSTVSIDGVRSFLRRARAGLGGVSDDRSALAFHLADGDGLVSILCAVSGAGNSLELSAIDDLVAEVHATGGQLDAELDIAARLATRIASGLTLRRPGGPTLFVVHAGRSYPVTQSTFLIGRDRGTVHLAIKDGIVSRHHAAVIQRDGAHYIKDLGSTHGITYKGMQIDNKRIAEGDVFQIGEHELRFTFQGDG